MKGLEKLPNLEELNLTRNPDLTKAQIAELQKALPKCRIVSNPKKQPAHPFRRLNPPPPQQHLHQSR